jgi:carbohydrate diacid regulator
MENILAEKLQNYIMGLIGSQVSVADSRGKIVSSTLKKHIGEMVKIPQESINGSNILTIEDNGKPSLAIPLYHNQQLTGLLVINDDPEKFLPQMPLVKSLAELLTQQYYDSIKPDLDSTDKFVCRLLFNKDPNQLPYLASQAQILGYRLDIPRIAFIIHLEGFWENYLNNNIQFSDEKESIILRKKRDLERTISGFFTKDTENITAYMGEDRFVLFKDAKSTPEDKVIKLLQQNFQGIVAPMINFNIKTVTAGIGRSRSGIVGLIQSCKEANSALVLGRKMWGDNRAYSSDDLGLLSIVGQGNRDKKIHFAKQILRNLDSDELMKTLECFFEENLNLTQTAERLGIHRNTVIYRLDQISKSLNRDPRNFEEAVEIKMALLIKRLFV